MSIEIPKLKWKDKKIILKSKPEYPGSAEQLQKVYSNTRRRRMRPRRRNIWRNTGQEYSKIDDRQQTTHPGSWEHTKKDKYQNIST